MVHDVIAVDHQTKLEFLLTFLKNSELHMAVVTKVHEEVGVDPTLKKIGIITIEDIIEEILQEEIEDEQEGNQAKRERQ